VTRQRVEIQAPVSATTYRALLGFLGERGGTFLLVERPSLGLSLRATRLLSDLHPYLTTAVHHNQWPGTELIGELALVRTFLLTTSSARVLSSASDGPYCWQQPGLLEDLCTMRPDGSECMTTIAHEQHVDLQLSKDELAAAHDQLPALRLMPIE
jgi:hypothetical protein